jgi:hypothetical protein
MNHAGSQRRLGCRGRRARLHPAFEGLDDAHAPAAARTGWELSGRLFGLNGFWRRRRCGQQFADAGDVGLACRAREQSVMPDAVEAVRQNMQQKAAHELVGIERHHLLALRAAAAVILVAECHPGLVEGDQAAVRDRDPVWLWCMDTLTPSREVIVLEVR